MSGCVDGGASITDGAMLPDPPPQLLAGTVDCLRRERTYASTSSRWEEVKDARIMRRAAAVVAARNCCATGSSEGSSAVLAIPAAPQDCGITNPDAPDVDAVTGGRSGAVDGFGSMATRTPLTPQTAIAPAPLTTLSARVLSVTTTPSE
jgi:hypothetical protein